MAFQRAINDNQFIVNTKTMITEPDGSTYGFEIKKIQIIEGKMNVCGSE